MLVVHLKMLMHSVPLYQGERYAAAKGGMEGCALPNRARRREAWRAVPSTKYPTEPADGRRGGRSPPQNTQPSPGAASVSSRRSRN